MFQIGWEPCWHFAFKEYKDATGALIIGGHTNGSVTFQLAQIRVGEGVVPISIVLYVDGSFIKRAAGHPNPSSLP